MTKIYWRQRITLLAIPSAAGSSPWKACLRLRSLVLATAAWTTLTILVLGLALRLAGYGTLKADNISLRARLQTLSSEMERSRSELEAAREADKDIRALLRLALPPVLAAAGVSGSGGPGPADRQPLLRSYLKGAAAAADPLQGGLEDLRRLSRERLASYREIAVHLAWRRRVLTAMPAGWPADGRLTSRYGRRLSPLHRDDESGDREFHPGVDIASSPGTPILAAAEGTVVQARWSGGYGRLVMLRHDLGYATLYGHASSLLVKEGERVNRGQVIAVMGSTGRSTGSHVHYEVWFNGKTVDPKRFLASSAP